MITFVYVLSFDWWINIYMPDLVGFSCILILYGGFDAWPINTEFLGGKVDII
jgi:hypothetical protein